MATDNHLGKTLYIATAAPATHDATGFEALSWTKVNGVQTMPQFGVSHASIDVPDLQTGTNNRVKGLQTGTDTTFQCRTVASDSGQGSCKTVANSADGIVSLKIGKGSGTGQALVSGDPVQYATGFLHSYREMQPTTTTHEGFEVTFSQNGLPVEDTEPA